MGFRQLVRDQLEEQKSRLALLSGNFCIQPYYLWARTACGLVVDVQILLIYELV